MKSLSEIVAELRAQSHCLAKLREQCQKIWEQTTANPYGQLFQIQHALAMLLSGLSGLASTPAPEAVNQRLLFALRDVKNIYYSALGSPDFAKAFIGAINMVAIEHEISAAESLPSSMESMEVELAEALKLVETQLSEKCEATCMFASDLAAMESARELLARYEQRKAK